MHITRKAMYAIKSLIYIASIREDRLCTITEISLSGKIPREYVAKILKELSDKGFLSSYRGIHGGYKLKKDLSEITFLDILEAVQGKLEKDFTDEDTSNMYKGPAYSFWVDLHDVIKYKMQDMNLEKLDIPIRDAFEKAES